MLGVALTRGNGGRRFVAPLCTLGLAIAAACGAPQVSPIRVRYLGPAGLPPVDPGSVELVRGRAQEPFVPIAELEVAPDGSSFEALVDRLRGRAAALGADAIHDVRSLYEVGSGQVYQSTNDIGPRYEDLIVEAAKAGFSLLLSRPHWIGVRATAIRFDTKSAPLPILTAAGGITATRPAEPPKAVASLPAAPVEKPPVEKP